jgi:hypothetical protein
VTVNRRRLKSAYALFSTNNFNNKGVTHVLQILRLFGGRRWNNL